MTPRDLFIFGKREGGRTDERLGGGGVLRTRGRRKRDNPVVFRESKVRELSKQRELCVRMLNGMTHRRMVSQKEEIT